MSVRFDATQGILDPFEGHIDMAWYDRLDDPNINLFFYLVIEGIPYVFTNCEDTGFPAPYCAWHSSSIPAYTVLHDTLKVSEGVSIGGWSIDEKLSYNDPGPLNVKLVDKRGVLRNLFATELATAATTHLSQTLGWPVPIGDEDCYRVRADDTTDFDSTGLAYVGKECFYYGYKSATAFGDGTNRYLDRGCYAWRSGSTGWDTWNLGYRHISNELNRFIPETISSNPTNWRKRRAILCCNMKSALDNTPLDGGFRGPHEFEAYSGFVYAAEPDSQDWNTWTLRLNPLISCIDREVGTITAKGKAGLPSSNSRYPTVITTSKYHKPITIIHLHVSGSSGTYSALYNDLNVSLVDSGGQPLYGQTLDFYTFLKMVGNSIKYHIENRFGIGAYSWPDCIKGGYSDETQKLEIQFEAGDAGVSYYIAFNIRFYANDGFNMLGQAGELEVEFPNAYAPMTHDDGSVYQDRLVCRSLKFIPMQSFWDGPRVWGHQQPFDLIFQYEPESLNSEKTFSDIGGYAVLSNGELVGYDSISDSAYAGFKVMHIDQRGLWGTQPEDYVQLDNNGSYGDLSVSEATWLKNCNIWKTWLRIASSTSGSIRSDYDHFTTPGSFCGQIDPSCFDLYSFESCANASSNRNLALSAPTNLKTWLQKECQFRQAILAHRLLKDGTIRIGVYPIIEAKNSDSLDERISDRAEYVSPTIQPINVIKVKTGWHVGKGKHAGPTATFCNEDSRAIEGQDHVLELDIPGMKFHVDDTRLIDNVLNIMAKWNKPGQIIDVYSDLSAILLAPGQTIGLTIPDIPLNDGSTGMSTRPAMVIGVSQNIHSPSSDWRTKIRCRLLPYQEVTAYCPMARVTSYTAGSTTLTLSENEYTLTNQPNPWQDYPCKDITYFEEGYRVYVFNKGNMGTAEIKTVGSISGNTMEINSALGFATGSICLVTYAKLSDGALDAKQKKWGFIADQTTQLLTGSQAPCIWGV